jgi:hypothetical protein
MADHKYNKRKKKSSSVENSIASSSIASSIASISESEKGEEDQLSLFHNYVNVYDTELLVLLTANILR